MYDILYPPVNGNSESNPSWSDALAADPSEADFWRFTDPVALALYRQEGRLDQLQDDVLAYVRWNGRWAPDELEYGQEIRRLLRASVLQPKGTFGYLSPHPTVYRAAGEGVLEIAGQRHHFGATDSIMFVPWLARVVSPGITGPVRIGRLQSISHLCLSCEAFPSVSALCERALSILRQTLPNQAA